MKTLSFYRNGIDDDTMIYKRHGRMISMKRVFVFPFGIDHIQTLMDDHPHWVVKPWGFNLIQIESPLDCRNEYLSWMIIHQGYKPLLAYYGLTTVLNACLLIITSLSMPFLSIHILYGMTVFFLLISHIPVMATLIINRLRHVESDNLPLLITILLAILYWFQPTLWFRYLTLQSMILILLWDGFVPFVSLFSKKNLYRLIRLKQKLMQSECLVKTNNGEFIKKKNNALKIDDEIALKTNETANGDGIIIHGKAMVKPWYGKQTFSIQPGSSIKAGSQIMDGSITFRLIQPLDQSELNHQIEHLVTSLTHDKAHRENKLIFFGWFTFSIVIMIIFGFTKITPIVLMVPTILVLWTYPLNHLNQWSNQSLFQDISHGLVPNGCIDGQTISEIHTVIIDSNLLKRSRDLEVDSVYLNEKMDHTLFFHMMMHVLRKSNDDCANAIIAYIRNHNLTYTDFRLSQSIYKKGLDILLNGSTIAYGDLETLKSKGIDTDIVKAMDMDASHQDDAMRYLAKDDHIIAIFRLKRPIYPKYRQLVESLKQHGYTTLLYSSTPYPGLNHQQTIYGFDLQSNKSSTLIDKIHFDQIHHQRYLYIHNQNSDPDLIDTVDLSISVGYTNDRDDLILMDPNPLIIPSWLNHHHLLQKTISISHRFIGPLIIVLMVSFGIIIPRLTSTIIEPTWLVLIPALIDILVSSNLVVPHYTVPALKADHSQSITIRLDTIDTSNHDQINRLIHDYCQDALIDWIDQNTLKLALPSDVSRYAICQLIRSNGYATKLIYEKVGK